MPADIPNVLLYHYKKRIRDIPLACNQSLWNETIDWEAPHSGAAWEEAPSRTLGHSVLSLLTLHSWPGKTHLIF